MVRFGLSVFLFALMLWPVESGAMDKDAGPLAGLLKASNSSEKDEISRGLNTLHDLAKDKGKYEAYAIALGFTSVAQAARASIGQPLPVYRVHLHPLAAYREGGRPEEILDDQPRTLLIPILADGEIRSSFMVAESDRTKMSRIIGQGSSNLLLNKKPEYLAIIQAAVLIPDLRLRFLARDIAGGFVLIPIKNYPFFELKAGEELPASEVFMKLMPIAKRLAKAIADSPDPDEPEKFRQPRTE
jgi:hypothetical protein